MSDKPSFFARLKQRKLVQWTVAYVAASFALLQGIDIVAQRFDWPQQTIRLVILAMIVGFFVTLVLAWYHGERGAQRVTGTELLILASLLAVGGGFLWHFASGSREPTAKTVLEEKTTKTVSPIPAKSIAVMPFENLSDDKANAYFADGIQNEIRTRLSKIADLKVISHTSTAHYASSPQNLPEIARQLGVADVVEGSVQKNADSVRVNVQLIKAATDSQIWADTYDRKLTDIFAVESEIASKIADRLQTRLTGPEAQAIKVRPTESGAAHDLYLKGLYFWNKRTAADLEKALGYFNQALAQDPNYGLAWAGMAEAYTILPLYGGASPADALPKAKEAANKAIQLDPTLAEPHAVLGNLLSTTFDFPGSVREFEKAIALDPNDATTHHWFGDTVLECIGANDWAIAEHQRALELDPLSLAINIDLGYSYYMAGRYPEGIAQVRKALELDPNSYVAHYNLGWNLEASGDLPGATAEYKKAVDLDSDPFALALLGHAEALAGKGDDALNILQKLATAPRYVPAYAIGLVHLGLGDKKQAMDWFEKSYQEGQPDLNTIRFDPLLKPLHGDPRFEALAEKIAPAHVLAALVSSRK